VGPGVITRELHRVLVPRGLFFPPNPGSWTTSTLGGNVATNAAGPRAYRYGSVRRWVRAAEVVLGTGERLHVGGRTTKRSVGPDLLSLLAGSEGTLGIFTELTLSLAPLPERRTGIVIPLAPGRPIGPLVRSLVTEPPGTLSAIEFVDAVSAGSLAEEAGSRFPGGRDLMLLELESADESSETRDLSRLLERLPTHGVSEEPLVVPDADELWTLRGRSGLALDRTMGDRIREDIAVPLPRLDELADAIAQIAVRHHVHVATFGHVGDGNLHPNFGIDPSRAEAAEIRDELYRATRRLGGTISAEHGVGSLKAPYLGLELDAGSLGLLRQLKRACDPDGILNPGKLLPAK
ncbi:MAG: FAD-binding oxidoreductase, partial [Thermoplasmata archaeon]|nr:FAD-binding oxidoreductase [Thermoplasmata archaeon]